MQRPRPGPALQLMTVALAAAIGGILYLSVTSLPFLAISPTSDATFGALNECLLREAPQRVGFTTGRDARRAAAWTTDVVALCAEGTPPRTWRLPGATVGAFSAHHVLWLSARGADAGPSGLFRLDSGQPRLVGDITAQALTGTAAGVVALEASGRLTSLDDDGRVLAVYDVPPAGEATLTSSGDGERVAVQFGGGLFAFDARTLTPLLAEAPCGVEALWWLRGGHHVRLTCGPDASWALDVDVDTGAREAAPQRTRAPSTLIGPEGPWVQPCDVLPCTAPEP